MIKWTKSRSTTIYYKRIDEFWRKEDKYRYLEQVEHRDNVTWMSLRPDRNHTWITEGLQNEFEFFMPLGDKQVKSSKSPDLSCLFKIFSNGNDSGRDRWVYNFQLDDLLKNTKLFADTYNSEVARWHNSGKPADIDSFLVNDEKRIKWTRNAKRDLKIRRYAEYSINKVRKAIYRPFCSQYLYSGKIFNKEVAWFPRILPTFEAEAENQVICLTDIGSEKPFMTLMVNKIPDLHLSSPGCGTQCFPFYTYEENGTNRRENITDWALEQFCRHYQDDTISKWDIFYYVYGVLHHPHYRTRYAANLKRELPHIPFAPDFWTFASAGKRLAQIHINYEQQPEYPLKWIETSDLPLDWRVQQMKLTRNKTQLVYNNFLTLSGIPSKTFDYRLGNRSALDWIIDQYQIKADKRSGITNDPNRLDDEQYIVRLIGQVITVSLETVEIVDSLPSLGIPDS